MKIATLLNTADFARSTGLERRLVRNLREKEVLHAAPAFGGSRDMFPAVEQIIARVLASILVLPGQTGAAAAKDKSSSLEIDTNFLKPIAALLRASLAGRDSDSGWTVERRGNPIATAVSNALADQPAYLEILLSRQPGQHPQAEIFADSDPGKLAARVARQQSMGWPAIRIDLRAALQ